MAIPLLALGMTTPNTNALGAFHEGAQARQTFDSNKVTIARQNMDIIGGIAMGAMGGKMDGPVDPNRFNDGLDFLERQGLDVAAFRNNPAAAPMVARASLTAQQQLALAQNEKDYELAVQRFQLDLQNALKGPDPTSDMIEYGAAQEQGYEGTLADWKSDGSSSAPSYGTTVLTGRDADGNVVPLQAGSSGGLVQSQLPEGVTFDPGALNAERAAGSAIGRGAGQAAMDLPSAQAEAERIAIQIGDLKAHPGLDEIFGRTLGIIPNQWGPTVPGTNKANAMARIEQMTGNAFLNGRQLLKGGGAITDFESKKAEAAFARLSTAQTKEEFVAGLDEFQAALEAGIAKLAKQSGNTEFSSGTVAPNGGQQMGDDPLGLF